MYGRPDVYYVRDSGELCCADCAIDGASMRDLDNLPRRARAALRLVQFQLSKPDPWDICRALEDSDKRGMIYRPGPWQGRPMIQDEPGGRYRDMTDQEMDDRYAKHNVLHDRTAKALRAVWELFGVVNDWDMDSKNGEYCGGCNVELSPAWGECDNCQHDDAVSFDKHNSYNYPAWWPDDVTPEWRDDGDGFTVSRCNYCPEPDDDN
jgi:hypothetical protein